MEEVALLEGALRELGMDQQHYDAAISPEACHGFPVQQRQLAPSQFQRGFDDRGAPQQMDDSRSRSRGSRGPGLAVAAPVPVSAAPLAPDASAGASYDSAVEEYGLKLRTWINAQVDAQLAEACPDVVQSELLALLPGLLQRELLAALPGLLQNEVGGALAETAESLRAEFSSELGAQAERIEGDVGKVAEAQGRLLRVVEGVSSEVEHMRSSGDQREFVSTLEELTRQVSQLPSRLSRHEAALEELSRRADEHGGQYEAAHDELRRNCEARVDGLEKLHAEARERHQRSNDELAGAAGALQTAKGQVGQLVGLVHEVNERFETLRHEVSDIVAREVSSSLAHDGQRFASRAELEESRRQLSESQAHLGKELAALQDQSLAELRAETTAAFRSEAAAVAALDEQLWLTDQRLGQRLDELARAHAQPAASSCRPSSGRSSPSNNLAGPPGAASGAAQAAHCAGLTMEP